MASTPDDLATRVSLTFAVEELARMDVLSKSDPVVVVYQKTAEGALEEVGRTEFLKNKKSAVFSTPVTIKYFFERAQHLKITVFDHDGVSNDVKKYDLIGSIEVMLGDIVGGSGGPSLMRELVSEHGHKHGRIRVRAQELRSGPNYNVTFRIEGNHLDKKDMFGKSDPFMLIFQEDGKGNRYQVYKTETIKVTLEPKWKARGPSVLTANLYGIVRSFVLTTDRLCSGDMDRTLTFEVYDWDKDGSHDLIGACTSTLNKLKGRANQRMPLINPKKVSKKGYTNSGELTIVQCDTMRVYSLMDYLSGGCEINLVVAVDYTASNGNPAYPTSLHYVNPYEPNEYMKAIKAVGTVLAAYDSDKQFPVFGFGARFPDGHTYHDFHVNLNPQNPFVNGVDGILAAYQTSLRSLQLHGPTNFAPIIHRAAGFAKRALDDKTQKYFVLLIITDGDITDMEETKAAIVRASSLPLSIVIVGVGSAEFASMHVLDSDNGPLRSGQEDAKRDIVQFVPFNSRVVHPDELARDLLAEIPSQLVSAYISRGILPNDPVVGQWTPAAAP